MEKLITELEAKINWLTKQLEDANSEIKQLKNNKNQPIEHSASIDLLQSMTNNSTEDTLQLYIEDSLDLLAPPPLSEEPIKTMLVEHQLQFDLLHEQADDIGDTTTTQIEQTNSMTTQQPELHDSKEAEISNANNESSSQKTETTTLTPEQKKRQKNQKNNRRLIKMLEDRYPKAFDWNQPTPLKVGIDKDMTLDEEFNESKQKRALAAYTRSDRYKKCLLSGKSRIDLEGTPVNDEPALPESMTKQKVATKKTVNRPKREKATQASPTKKKAQVKHTQKTTQTNKQDEIYNDLSPEDRMKAKLEKLLNKS